MDVEDRSHVSASARVLEVQRGLGRRRAEALSGGPRATSPSRPTSWKSECQVSLVATRAGDDNRIAGHVMLPEVASTQPRASRRRPTAASSATAACQWTIRSTILVLTTDGLGTVGRLDGS